MIARMWGPSLEDTTMKVFFDEAMPPELMKRCQWRRGKRELRFPNGSVIIFRSLDRPWKHEGMQLGWFYLDEAVETGMEEANKILKRRLRLQHVRQCAWYTSNPGDERSYLFREFHRNGEIAPGHFMVTARSTENPYLTDDYKAELLQMDDMDFKLYVMGEWVSTRGAVFYNWDENVHVVPAFSMPSEWWRFRMIDVGIDHPFACLWGAVDEQRGRLFVYREWVESNLTIDQNAQAIRDLSIGEAITYNVVDPAAKAREMGSGKSVQEQLVEAGITPLELGDNDVNASILRIRTLLGFERNEAGQLIRAPRLYVMDDCPETARQMGAWGYDRRKSLVKPKPSMRDCDCVAALRYGVQSVPHLHPTEISVEPPPPSDFDKCLDQALRQAGQTLQIRSSYAAM